jgi:hypothetical protein
LPDCSHLHAYILTQCRICRSLLPCYRVSLSVVPLWPNSSQNKFSHIYFGPQNKAQQPDSVMYGEQPPSVDPYSDAYTAPNPLDSNPRPRSRSRSPQRSNGGYHSPPHRRRSPPPRRPPHAPIVCRLFSSSHSHPVLTHNSRPQILQTCSVSSA